MRLNILGFAAGVLVVQNLSELPTWTFAALTGVLLILPSLRWNNGATRLLTLIACCTLGVAWATWRADIRLADHLDSAWEGRDIEVTGIIAGLPQDFSNGTRFEFDVNSASTVGAVPQRVMLSWYQGRRDEEQFELNLNQ